MEHLMKSKKIRREYEFDIINAILMLVLVLITLYPFWYCIVLSFNDGIDSMKGPLGLLPRKFTLDNYEFILGSTRILQAAVNSVLRTVVGVLLTVTFTGIVAYGLSKRHIAGRKLYMMIFIITMYFSGGMIPMYLLIKNLGLLDNFLVYVLPGMFTFYYAILLMAYFDSLSKALEEAATIDGAGYFRILFCIILPASLPIFATVALFEAVGQWNSWYDTLTYVRSDSLITLQGIMAKMIQQTEAIQEAQRQLSNSSSMSLKAFSTIKPATVRVATMMVTVFPITVCYPFLQQYFVKGIMLGSVKE